MVADFNIDGQGSHGPGNPGKPGNVREIGNAYSGQGKVREI